MTTGREAIKMVTATPAGLPRHVAVIMDGNGRWARRRGLPRVEGHRKGVQTLRDIVRHAGEIGIDYLTLYSFSSENWSRPADEVRELMSLLKHFVRRDLSELAANNVRVLVIGERDDLQPDIRGLLEDAERRTAHNDGLTLVVAFNYGSRNEIARAVRGIAVDVAAGRLPPDAITESLISQRLDTAGIPDPDLILRTSGEQRLSNFLLWQAAYSEFVFAPEYWPEFTAGDFDRAIGEYLGRERRFGGIPAAVEA